MNYLAQLNEMRNKMHQDIILHTIKDNRDPNDFVIELNRPFTVPVELYRPEDPNDFVIATVSGVDGTTGEIVGHDQRGNQITVVYNDLTMETLAMLHGEVVSKNYKVKHLV